MRAPCDLGKKTFLFEFKAHQKGVICSPSTGALLVLLRDLGKKKRFFPYPKLEVPCSQPQRGVVWSLFTC